MKYIVVLLLLLSGCTSKNEDLNQIDKDLEEIRQTTKHIEKQLRVTDCGIGVLSAINHFHKQLYKKVTKEQIDAVWKDCEELGK